MFQDQVHLSEVYREFLMNHHVVLELLVLYHRLEKRQVQQDEHELYVIQQFLKKHKKIKNGMFLVVCLYLPHIFVALH